jgi:hypothetical protein
MATLTYDPTPADQPEFTAEEQDSIAVGEQLEQQEQQLLAGKYTNAKELEKAYVELQRKLGTPEEEASEEPVNETEDSEETEEVEQETEEVEQETEEKEEESQISMSEEDIKYLKDAVGGEEAYTELVSWASDNLSEQEVDAYDHVMGLDNPYAAFFAVKALNMAYQNANGYEGQMLTGKAAANTNNQFRSQAEVIEAMSDPRYDNDPAYRNDVFDKLDRSNLSF